jgi:two-component sensor histidine kinase
VAEAGDIGLRLAALEAAVEARTRDLKAALDQRTALIHELDHRVKNNLQLISALMLMQARRAGNPEVRRALDGMAERLHAIGAVHRRLFQREDVGRFDLSDFVRDLVSDLGGASGRPEIRFACALEPVEAPAERAAALALLINELLTNALRHAFPGGRAGVVSIDLSIVANDLRIEIADDGVGMSGPAGGSCDGSQGFGLTIVDLLSRQLHGRLSRDPGPPGVRTLVVLPLKH